MRMQRVVKLQHLRSLDFNSYILFSNVDLSAERIISFSVRHRLHHLDRLEYAEALLNISQLIRKVLSQLPKRYNSCDIGLYRGDAWAGGL